MDDKLIREKSLLAALQLGYPVNTDLPSLDVREYPRSTEDIFKRLLCLHATAACAYGFDRLKAIEWIKQENIYAALSSAEKTYLENGVGDNSQLKLQVEGMWAIAWVLGLVPQLDFSENCDGQFVMMLPNLKILENSFALKNKINLKPFDNIVEKCDLAYCINWYLRQGNISNRRPSKKSLSAYVASERWRALLWVTGMDDWDDISLDT
jgi:hypothetical protein